MTRNWPAWPNQAPHGQLAFTSMSTFIPSILTGKLRSLHPPLSSEALACTILANKATQAASPESHKLGYFPTDIGASGWQGRMFLSVDMQHLSGPSLCSSLSVWLPTAHCSLKLHTRMGLLGGWRDGAALEPGSYTRSSSPP